MSLNVMLVTYCDDLTVVTFLGTICFLAEWCHAVTESASTVIIKMDIKLIVVEIKLMKVKVVGGHRLSRFAVELDCIEVQSRDIEYTAVYIGADSLLTLHIYKMCKRVAKVVIEFLPTGRKRDLMTPDSFCCMPLR